METEIKLFKLLFNVAMAGIHHHHFGESEKILDLMEERFPDEFCHRYGKIVSYFMKEDFDGAIKFIEALIDGNQFSDHLGVLLSCRIRCEVMLGDLQKAMASLKQWQQAGIEVQLAGTAEMYAEWLAKAAIAG